MHCMNIYSIQLRDMSSLLSKRSGRYPTKGKNEMTSFLCKKKLFVCQKKIRLFLSKMAFLENWNISKIILQNAEELQNKCTAFKSLFNFDLLNR